MLGSDAKSLGSTCEEICENLSRGVVELAQELGTESKRCVPSFLVIDCFCYFETSVPAFRNRQPMPYAFRARAIASSPPDAVQTLERLS